jgi:hypothetical protein
MEEELTQINGGDNTCDYCGGCFRERRYRCEPYERDEEEKWFCLPECLVGYEWFVVGRNCESLEEQRQCRKEFRQAFRRAVYPAPLSCFFKTEPRPRDTWLHEDCRDRLEKDEDRAQAKRELFVGRGGMRTLE